MRPTLVSKARAPSKPRKTLMRWLVRSIRNARESAPFREGGARPFHEPGAMGMGSVRGEGPGATGLAGVTLPGPALPAIVARSGGEKPGAPPGPRPPKSAATSPDAAIPSKSGNPVKIDKSSLETPVRAQPSGKDGVPEDMATLVLDNPALGTSTALRPDSMPNPHVNYAEDESSDAAVMLRVAAGDEAGFNFLVGKYHRAMISFLYRMVRNQAVAEELAQEVFLRVYRSRESYRAEAKFSTWLYRIATNLAVNQARDTKYERSAQTIYLDAPDEETGSTPDVADDDPSAEQQMIRDERMAAIRKHVMDLPERQRMAVLMHKYQGMDYRQIGDVLKLSESATKSLLFRAYQTLRDKLKDFV
jgi:RNA polymerase sigma-70 factor (ECF subfamily)